MEGICLAEGAKHFVKYWVLHGQAPEELVAENGVWFTSKYLQDLCRLTSIKNNLTATYHHKQMGKLKNETVLTFQHYEHTQQNILVSGTSTKMR